MISTFVLLFFTMYIAACVAIEIISKDSLLRGEQESRDILDYYFCSLDMVMITFIQFVTMDSIATIYVPLVKRRPLLCIYFSLLIVIISIALMNLVTAVLVETAILNSKKDQELALHRIRRLRPQIKKAFHMMDLDNSKTVSRAEVLLCHAHFPASVLKVVPRERLPELFDILDTNGSGQIGEDAFVEGVMEFILSDVSFTTMQEIKLLTQMRRWQEQTATELLCISTRLKHLDHSTRQSMYVVDTSSDLLGH